MQSTVLRSSAKTPTSSALEASIQTIDEEEEQQPLNSVNEVNNINITTKGNGNGNGLRIPVPGEENMDTSLFSQSQQQQQQQQQQKRKPQPSLYSSQHRASHPNQYIAFPNHTHTHSSLSSSQQLDSPSLSTIGRSGSGFNNSNASNSGTFFLDDWSTNFQSLGEFLKRLMDYQQMDFEAAFDDMIALVSTKPQQVYVMAKFRKHTKNHWARDDPAFAAVQIFFLFVCSVSYAITFRLGPSVTSFIFVILRTVFLEWLMAGVIMATLCRYIANTYLRVNNRTHSVIQTVEWRYAFDIHCNSFFVFFLFTYILQFFLLPMIGNRSLAAMIFANAFYVIACTCYFYITHLGYRALPYLTRTEVFFYPTLLSLGMFLLFFILGLLGENYRFNLTRILTRFFFAN